MIPEPDDSSLSAFANIDDGCEPWPSFRDSETEETIRIFSFGPRLHSYLIRLQPVCELACCGLWSLPINAKTMAAWSHRTGNPVAELQTDLRHLIDRLETIAAADGKVAMDVDDVVYLPAQSFRYDLKLCSWLMIQEAQSIVESNAGNLSAFWDGLKDCGQTLRDARPRWLERRDWVHDAKAHDAHKVLLMTFGPALGSFLCQRENECGTEDCCGFSAWNIDPLSIAHWARFQADYPEKEALDVMADDLRYLIEQGRRARDMSAVVAFQREDYYVASPEAPIAFARAIAATQLPAARCLLEGEALAHFENCQFSQSGRDRQHFEFPRTDIARDTLYQS